MRFRIVAAAALFLFGAAFGMIAAGSAWHVRVWIAKTKRADGTVVDYTPSLRSRGNTSDRRAIVRFMTEDWRVVDIRSRIGGTPRPYAIGERVIVLYQPAKPESALLSGWRELWLLPIGFAAPAFVILAVATVLLISGLRTGTPARSRIRSIGRQAPSCADSGTDRR